MSDISLTKDQQGIVTLSVNRPSVRNALDWSSQMAFADAIEEVGQMDDVSALIITGIGKAFLAGGDIHELQDYPAGHDGLRLATVMGDALNALEKLPCLTIARINGPARGGGAEVAVACDLRIMSDEASIAFVHTRLGLIPGWGGLHRLYRLVGYSNALELLATGQVLDAVAAQQIGLVNRVVKKDELDQGIIEIAQQVNRNSRSAIVAVKQALQQMGNLDGGKAQALERQLFVKRWQHPERRDLFADALPKKKTEK